MPDGAGDAFTLLTTEPGPDVAPIHDRQMVVIDRADMDEDGSSEIAIFSGPGARERAIRHADREYGAFDEIELEPYNYQSP